MVQDCQGFLPWANGCPALSGINPLVGFFAIVSSSRSCALFHACPACGDRQKDSLASLANTSRRVRGWVLLASTSIFLEYLDNPSL